MRTETNNIIDFNLIAAQLLQRAEFILPDLVPGGKQVGQEYRAGTIYGGPGSSFGLNLNTGVWKDFASGEGGKDIISLYAKIHSINQGEAAKRLNQIYLNEINIKAQYPQQSPPKDKPIIKLIPPPKDADQPDFGRPDLVHEYRGQDSELLFYVTRYSKEGKKTFTPWSWSDEGKWVRKLWEAPRPLYNLHKLHKYADKPVLIVEGEKSADAVEKITKAYVPITWPGGAQAFAKADWTPIYGRKVLLWPDADRQVDKKTNELLPYNEQPGPKAMASIAMILFDHCPEIKLLQVGIDPNRPDGWDAGDALKDGWNAQSFSGWAKPLVYTVNNKPKSIIPEVMPDQPSVGLKKTEPREVNINIGPQDADTVQVPVDRKLVYRELGLEMIQGRLVMNSGNVLRLLKGMPEFKDIVWLDTFYNEVFTKWETNETRVWADIDSINFYIMLQNLYGFSKISKHHVEDAIYSLASRNRRNEPQDWLKSLVWDQSPRLDNFFLNALKTKDTDYTRVVCKNFMVGLIARIMEPGCKVDQMIILEGKQGTGKSTFASIIGGKWFTEANADFGSKDFDMSLKGKLLMEIAELDKMGKADIKTIKNKISQRIDEYRPAYGRLIEKFPRTCLFIGTTNEDDYLDDTTGARRFFPLIVGHIDTDYVESIREQVFAEAYQLYKDGYEWHTVPPRADEVQESRRKQDPWEETIKGWIQRPGTVYGDDGLPISWENMPLTTDRIWRSAFNGDISRLDRVTSNRIAKSMRVLGYKSKPKWFSKRQIKVWMLQNVADENLKRSEIDTEDKNGSSDSDEKSRRPYNFAPGADNSEARAF